MKRIKVLLVEDNIFVQLVHKTLFESLDCDVVIVGNATEALELSRQGYDYIFIDIGLPDINGIELAPMLRLHASLGRSTHFLALTAYTDLETQKACLDAGIDVVLHKPISIEKLKSVMGLV